MANVLNPLRWPTNWIASYKSARALPPCGSITCSRSKSLWQRMRDRRRPAGAFLQGVFYCHPQCLETALTTQLSRLRIMAPTSQPPNRIPLGLLMVARGKLTYIEVQAALEAQRRARSGKIGEWIEKLGFATEQEVTAALALQWGCPMAASFDPATIHSPGEIPLSILEAFQMLPVNYAAATNTLYLAFGERVDHAALYAIEKILDCRTQPCVAKRKSIARKLEALRQLARPLDVEFGPTNDLAEMARIASSYMTRLSPELIRLSRIGRFIWVRLGQNSWQPETARLRSKKNRPASPPTNLIFRLAAEPRKPLPSANELRNLYAATHTLAP